MARTTTAAVWTIVAIGTATFGETAQAQVRFNRGGVSFGSNRSSGRSQSRHRQTNVHHGNKGRNFGHHQQRHHQGVTKNFGHNHHRNRHVVTKKKTTSGISLHWSHGGGNHHRRGHHNHVVRNHRNHVVRKHRHHGGIGIGPLVIKPVVTPLPQPIIIDDPVVVQKPCPTPIVITRPEPVVVPQPEVEVPKPVGDTELALELTNEAKQLFFQGDYKQSVAIMNEVVELSPKSAAAHQFRGLGHFAMGNYDAAAADIYETLLNGTLWNWDVIHPLYGNDRARYGRQYKALSRAARLDKKSMAKHFCLAYHHLVLGHLDHVERELKIVLEIQPREPVVTKLLAVVEQLQEEKNVAKR